MPRDAKEKQNVTQLPERVTLTATVNQVQIQHPNGQPAVRCTFTTELDNDVLRLLAQSTGTEIHMTLAEMQLPLFGDDENGEGETEAAEG